MGRKKELKENQELFFFNGRRIMQDNIIDCGGGSCYCFCCCAYSNVSVHYRYLD
jgi:hypothetical protein